MDPVFWLDKIPLWSVFFFIFILVLVSIWIGIIVGHRRRRNPEFELEASATPIITSILGLLAFMLAFTFGIAAQNFQARRQLLLNEVNAIGTAYLRAGLLLEPQRSQIRKLLSDYVDIRAELSKGVMKGDVRNFDESISRSELLQNQMWSLAESLPEKRISPLESIFVSSLNEMIDLHTSRLTSLRYRIPTTIWDVLFFITILSMAMVGYQAGLSDKKIIRVGIVLALAFSLVIYLIVDLDRAGEGRMRVGQRPMLELQQKIKMTQNTAATSEKTSINSEK
jgi:hypothetical protein